MSSAEQRQEWANRYAPDRSPACPRCGDLSTPGAKVCGTCGRRLLPLESELPERTRA